MLQIIISLIGLAIAIFAFIWLIDKFPSITKSMPLAIFVFILFWGAGIWVSYIAWWLGIFVAIIAFIVYVIKKKRPLEMNNENTDFPNSEDNNESK